MRNFFSILFLSFILCNCTNDEIVPEVKQETIAQIISKNPDFSSLVAALNKTDLTNTFELEGTYTLFAPTNAAFTAFLENKKYAKLDDVPTEALKEILLNHVLSTSVFAKDIKTEYVKTLAKGAATSENTLSMFLNAESGVRINGVASVTEANILASNGVIHQVDNVIDLPTIATHAAANPNFSSLVAALTEPKNTTNFINELSGTVLYTVFAPTNAAFTDFYTEYNLMLNDIPEPTLNRTLKYHVIEGKVLSTDLPTSGTVIKTWAGMEAENSFIFLSPQIRLKDSNNRECAIDKVDIQCTNGVIHILGKVLFPAEIK
jgi:uncharacterized surface protein with fasciclin (FAS1) repeats